MANKPTISDVAERAGFSTATVSAVINNKDTVSPSTRETVLRVIQELNYRPREAARRRLRSNGPKSLGLIIKEDDNPYYGEIVDGVRQVAQEQGYLPLIASSEGSHEQERQIVEFMIMKDIDGLLITPALDGDSDLSHIFELKRRNVPFVLLEQVRGIQTNLVDIDNVAASEAVAAHLMELGHSYIVHFAGPEYSAHSEERIAGVRRAFSRSQLAFPERNIIHAGAHPKDGYETGLEFFSEHRDSLPTAVTCYNDLVALGLLSALRELSIRVPEDVSVFGFDDLDLLKYAPWPLSSVRIPKQEMGARAAEILIEHLEADDALPLEKVNLGFELVLRETTAPPHRASGGKGRAGEHAGASSAPAGAPSSQANG